MPENGRAFEGFGEDPLLASDMGVADIDGIQSHRVMAQAKEFAVYSQETDRGALDDQVSDRAARGAVPAPVRGRRQTGSRGLAHVRLPAAQRRLPVPGRRSSSASSTSGGSPGSCARTSVPSTIRRRRSTAGTALIKPASVAGLTTPMRQGLLPVPTIDPAVERVLATMFAYGVIGRDPTGDPGDPVDSPEHAARGPPGGGSEPPSCCRTVAASCHCRRPPTVRWPSSVPTPSGIRSRPGSARSRVEPPFVSTPLDAIRLRAGKTADVTYSPGGSTTAPLPPVPPEVLTPASGQGHGLTLTLVRAGPEATYIQTVEPTVDTSIRPYPGGGLAPARGAAPDAPVEQRRPAGGLDQQVLGSSSSIGGRRTLGGRSASEPRAATSCCLPAGPTSTPPGPARSPRPRPATTRSRCRGPAHRSCW